MTRSTTTECPRSGSKRRGIAVLLLCAAAFAWAPSAASQSADAVAANWQGSRALRDIAQQLSFGVRALDAPGHAKTVTYIEAQLRGAGLEPQQQRFESDAGGQKHVLVNLVARFHPENPRRILLGTHYDSIIRAYRDKAHPDAPMPGANNSASGVALLLETARVLKTAKVPPPFGIDLVFFDGEEGPLSLGAGDQRWQPLGSPYFAAHLGQFYPVSRPSKAAIFDMVCWREQKLRPEQASLIYAGEEVDKFWALGRALAPRFFTDEPTAAIFDDQIALDQVHIPAFLVIGFEYEPWFNTTGDTLDKCSEDAMNAVGRTLIRYIYAP